MGTGKNCRRIVQAMTDYKTTIRKATLTTRQMNTTDRQGNIYAEELEHDRALN